MKKFFSADNPFFLIVLALVFIILAGINQAQGLTVMALANSVVATFLALRGGAMIFWRKRDILNKKQNNKNKKNK